MKTMKTILLLLAGLWAAPFCRLVAADNHAMLLKGNSITTEADQAVVASGNASVVVGDVQINAAQIRYDREQKTLRCIGEATLRSHETTMTAKDLVIDVGDRRLLTLSHGKISIEVGSPQPVFQTVKQSGQTP